MSRRGENIYKRKDGRWEGRYIKNRICNKAQYGYVYAHSYQEVKEKLYSEKMNVQKDFIKNKDMKFSELCGLWFLSQKANLKASTVQRYSSMLNNHIIPFFNNSYVSEITTCSLTAFVAYLRESSGLSEKTTAGTLSLVKAVLRYGEMINVKHSCVLTAVTVKVKSKEMRVLSQDEYIRLTTFLSQETDTYSVGILIALMTGIRIGELCALRYNDIDMNNKRIQISKTMQRLNDSSGKGTYVSIDKPKSSSSVRIIPVPEILLEIINKQNYEPDDYILTGNSKYIEPRTLQYRYKNIMKKLGITGTTFHTLRHSFATRCVEVGFDIKSLSEILGHSSVNITLNRYVHSSFELKAKNMEKLNDFLDHLPSDF